MFGRKKLIENEEQILSVHTIPAEFYAGVNPVVKFKQIERLVTEKSSSLTPAEKKAFDQTTAVGSGKKFHPIRLFSNHFFLLSIGVLLFVAFVGGAVWYYREMLFPVNRPVALTPPPLTESPVESAPIEDNLPVTDVSTSASVVDNQLAATSTFTDLPIEFPALALAASADLDSDGLTDDEEEIFKTDPGNPDTDNDGYTDAHEIFYLYNPAGKQPMRLVDAGVVNEFTQMDIKYRLLMPRAWAGSAVESGGKDMLFTALSGDSIEVRTMEKDPGESFTEWFGRNAPTQTYGDLREFSTYTGDKGYVRSDKLVYYLVGAQHVYVLLYRPNEAMVRFPVVLQLMARSFRLPESDIATAAFEPIAPNGLTVPKIPSIPVNVMDVVSSTEDTTPSTSPSL